MALLQISEPGQSPEPHQRRVAVGIDLGTTHSLVAAVRHGVAECLPDEQGRVILPSVVRYLDAAQGGSGGDGEEQRFHGATFRVVCGGARCIHLCSGRAGRLVLTKVRSWRAVGRYSSS